MRKILSILVLALGVVTAIPDSTYAQGRRDRQSSSASQERPPEVADDPREIYFLCIIAAMVVAAVCYQFSNEMRDILYPKRMRNKLEDSHF